MPGQSGAGQGAWVVLTGRCGCPRLVELLGAGLAVEWVDLEAVHSKTITRIAWRELRDASHWRQGWV